MKFSFLYLLLLLPILAISQSSDQNWVKTKTYKEPTTNALATPTPAQAVTQVSYFMVWVVGHNKWHMRNPTQEKTL